MSASPALPDSQPPFASELAAYVSVDVETAGPIPNQYALLSIGACLVSNPRATFYVELQPTSMEYDAKALSISGLSLEHLLAHGVAPHEAMLRFEKWLAHAIHPGIQPIFVAFNAPFDWMFVNEYFHRYLHRNPFGHSALDIKAFYMGLKKVPWKDTGFKLIGSQYANTNELAHHALQDAIDQGRLFRALLDEAAQS